MTDRVEEQKSRRAEEQDNYLEKTENHSIFLSGNVLS